jgi:hypothetical protein
MNLWPRVNSALRNLFRKQKFESTWMAGKLSNLLCKTSLARI